MQQMCHHIICYSSKYCVKIIYQEYERLGFVKIMMCGEFEVFVFFVIVGRVDSSASSFSHYDDGHGAALGEESWRKIERRRLAR